MRPSEFKTLGCPGTNQALGASASKSTWERAITPQVGLYNSQGNGVSAQSPTWTTPINGHGQQFDICFPSFHQVPLMLQLGGLLP